MTDFDNKVHLFHQDISGIPLPGKFTFPFYYEPHPLAVLAAEQLCGYLDTQQDFVHNFGLDSRYRGLAIGKMFGVLVVQNEYGAIGFLAAFSGKLADSNEHRYFVPPVYDLLQQHDFFLTDTAELNKINDRIAQLESDPRLTLLIQKRADLLVANEVRLAHMKAFCQKQKAQRHAVRAAFEAQQGTEAYSILTDYLHRQSSGDTRAFKQLQQQIHTENEAAEADIRVFTAEIDALKHERKIKSAMVQDHIFRHYTFVNKDLQTRSLYEIFHEDLGRAPLAGTGECAAPKLLQYAFLHHWKPVCMAEFWWGQSPKSAIRKHKEFYPSCRGKCEPVLKYMLTGIETDEDVLHVTQSRDCDIAIIYEDEYLAVINKPHDLLSVPGKYMEDAVSSRMKKRYPAATGPLVVHRLDMATSGLMLIAKDKKTHTLLQRQFLKKTIQKRYVAILEGHLSSKSGTINLPLRVDLEDRPRQLVCYEYGKSALTRYEVVDYEAGHTRIHFWPVTGRTHQLRVHASHPEGLNMPIVGDDLYGHKAARLFLHAEELRFIHPYTKKEMVIESPAPF